MVSLWMPELRHCVFTEAFLPGCPALALFLPRSLHTAGTLRHQLTSHTFSWEHSYALFTMARAFRELAVNLSSFCLYSCRKWLLGGNCSLCASISQVVQYAGLPCTHILSGSVLTLGVRRGKLGTAWRFTCCQAEPCGHI